VLDQDKTPSVGTLLKKYLEVLHHHLTYLDRH